MLRVRELRAGMLHGRNSLPSVTESWWLGDNCGWRGLERFSSRPIHGGLPAQVGVVEQPARRAPGLLLVMVRVWERVAVF